MVDGLSLGKPAADCDPAMEYPVTVLVLLRGGSINIALVLTGSSCILIKLTSVSNSKFRD